MSQTVAIILKLDEKRVAEFEEMFKTKILPLWSKFKAEGKLIAASLTPVTGGDPTNRGVCLYILHVEVPSMVEHEEFDSNPLFNEFLPKALELQPEEPDVMFGETLFKV